MGMEALIDDHIKNFVWDLEDFAIPAWIHYVDPNGKVKIGFDHKDLESLLDTVFQANHPDEYSEFDEFKEFVTNLWQEFVENPEAYADRLRKMVDSRYHS